MRSRHDTEAYNVYCFLDSRADNLLDGLMQSGVYDLHTGIPQGQRSDFRPAVMSIQSRFAHKNFDFLFRHVV
jgi:hypothetical protein